jgi:hypothetical protein
MDYESIEAGATQRSRLVSTSSAGSATLSPVLRSSWFTTAADARMKFL